MNDGRSAARHLADIIYQVFNIEIDPIIYMDQLRNIIEPREQDPIALIADVLQQQALLNDDSIANIVIQQIGLFRAEPQQQFKCKQSGYGSFIERWQAYRAKLEDIIKEIERRTIANYEINLVMPPQRQILELQQECLDLTAEYYGGNGVLSYFYLQYIRMCEAANITRFKYYEMPKFIAPDKYVSLSNFEYRSRALKNYDENIFKAYIQQGGIWARGRCDIDATSIANVFYYKHAKQLLFLNVAKNVIVKMMQMQDGNIEHYNQLPVEKRQQLWRVIQNEFPFHNDAENIFLKFANFCNGFPGACFTDLPHELKHAAAPAKLHAATKIAGLISNNLVLISRKLTEDWTPKRYLVMHWERKYPLSNLRTPGSIEHLRIWPNEMPYSPSHGLSLCGDGLIEGLEQYGSIAYEWNVPIDDRAEMNNDTRDIEKMFREMMMLSPPLGKQLLPGEEYLYLFQNTVAYSTQSTQHLHIGRGTLALYPVFNLPATSSVYSTKLQATVEIVHVGLELDSIYLRFYFKELPNESLLRFLIKLNLDLMHDFDQNYPVDAYIFLSVALPDYYVFILEPHALLLETPDRKFVNPENGKTAVRKPQYLIPEAASITDFAPDHALYNGRQFLSESFDATCKRGIYQYIQDYFQANI